MIIINISHSFLCESGIFQNPQMYIRCGFHYNMVKESSADLGVNVKIVQNRPTVKARTYPQLPLRQWGGQWGAGNVYLLVLSSWKVNIAENLIAIMGL